MWDFFCTFAPAKVFTMEDNFAIQLFEGKKVRLDQQARKYWKVLKGRLIKEGNESVTNCYQLKLPS